MNKKIGEYEVKLQGYFYLITIYDCYNKKEVKREVNKFYGKQKITWISKKQIY